MTSDDGKINVGLSKLRILIDALADLIMIKPKVIGPGFWVQGSKVITY